MTGMLRRVAGAVKWSDPRRALTVPALIAGRLDLRRPTTAIAAASVGVTVVTLTSLTLVLLTPLPGRGASWLALEVEPVQTPQSSPPAHRPRFPAGNGPGFSPPPGPVAQPSGEFVGWAILDRRTGSIIGSETMLEVSTTASMIKAWIAADYLRLVTEAGWQPDDRRLGELELIIRDSHNGHTEDLFQELGAAESIERLISICQLTDSRPYRDYWSNTQLSPRDAARMGLCIADGRAAGPVWTEWLLEQMRAVRGVGDFGIRQAFAAEQRAEIAIKNGWIDRSYDGNWHVNCLAIGDTWTMGIMTRYPVHLGYQHGAGICESLAAEHLMLLL